MGQVLDHSHLCPGTGRGWEAKAGTANAFNRCIDQLDLLQLFLTAFGLGAARGAGPETIDVGLLCGDLLLLAFIGRLCRFLFLLFLLEVSRVIAEIAAGDPTLGRHDLVADAVQEGAVMADHDQGSGLLLQIVFQPLNGLHIEVVGGLVEQQQIRILKQDLAKRDAHLPPA